MHTAIVTGASRGIGRAIAEILLKNDFRVAICARGLKPLLAMQEEWGTDRLYVQSANVGSRDGAYLFARDAMRALGHVDLLVNNAGAFAPDPLFDKVEGTFEDLLQANLYSAFYMSKAVVPHMRERRAGTIVNIGSVAGTMAYPAGGLYTVSKFAVNGLTKAMRAELKDDGIRVTHIVPGATYTSSWEGADIPEERFMPARDIAEAVWTAWSVSDRTVLEEIVLRPQEGDL